MFVVMVVVFVLGWGLFAGFWGYVLVIAPAWEQRRLIETARARRAEGDFAEAEKAYVDVISCGCCSHRVLAGLLPEMAEFLQEHGVQRDLTPLLEAPDRWKEIKGTDDEFELHCELLMDAKAILEGKGQGYSRSERKLASLERKLASLACPACHEGKMVFRTQIKWEWIAAGVLFPPLAFLFVYGGGTFTRGVRKCNVCGHVPPDGSSG